MKSIWLSALTVPEQEVRGVMGKLKSYGLNPSGHQWNDDLAAMAWMGAKEALCNPQCAFWAILGGRQAWQKPETRYGLAMLALCVQARRGVGFPIVLLQTGAEPLTAADLPTPLQRAVILPALDAGTPAKLVAKAHVQPPALPAAYYLDMVGNPQFGQWFEVRPTRDEWPGVIFGVDEGEIKFQAVGPAGQLPTTSTLNFPMQGLKMDFKGQAFTAWALRNTLSAATSYYVKVEGAPGRLLFGAFSEAGEAEMYHVTLK
ncbi:MAG: hypothetical protein HZB24_02975 [Desulfobacterales bacterium]|nr:hypothetical protein [Desulfobacterales bacterium]